MQKCKKYQHWMWMKIYGELDEYQKSELNNHLNVCLNCSLVFEEIVQTHHLLNKKIQIKPTTSFLLQNRNELHQRLLLARQAKFTLSWRKKTRDVLSLDFSLAIRWTTALAMLLLGIFLGSRLFRSDTTKQLQQCKNSPLSNATVASIESINYDAATGQVLLTLNALQQLTIRGDVESPEIKPILAQTLVADERPNIRLKTVSLLSLTKSYDKKIVEALIEVLEKDENPGIRLKAIRLLKDIPFSQPIKHVITNVLIQVLLNEQNSAIRNEAIDGLNKLKNEALAPIIFNAAKNDSNEYVRSKAAILLQRTKNPEIPENY